MCAVTAVGYLEVDILISFMMVYLLW